MKIGRKTKKYSENVRVFAMTMNFYSTAAYEYVRRTFGKHLPSISTIRRWYQSVNGEPGISSESIQLLKFKVAEAKQNAKKILVSLVFDEMAIRRQIIWDNKSKRFLRYVDMGCRSEDSDNREVATECLLFIVNSINERWKTPIAHYFVNKLTGADKANIVDGILKVLDEIGVEVVSMTFDGAPSNKAMANLMGADLRMNSKLKTVFKNPASPKKEVAVFLDICHCIKLVRNTLGQKGLIYDPDGNPVLWQYIVDLEKLQSSEGLTAATRLRSQHINFKTQKMKVRYATQVFSDSVADALTFCAQLYPLYPQFKDCEATVKFLKIFNKLFDILNSKNFLCRGFKQSLNVNTADEFFSFFAEAEEYIRGLTINKTKKIIDSASRTGFIGFIMGMHSMTFLYNRLVLGQEMRYLLGIKFSQDHIETLFSVFRSLNGFNNNPNVVQFTAAFKRIMVKNQIKASYNANCLDHGTEQAFISLNKPSRYTNAEADRSKEIRNQSSLTKLNSIAIAPLIDENEQDEELISNFNEAIRNEVVISEYISNVVVYISGFVERHIKDKIKCEHCFNALVTEDKACSALISAKNRGGLLVPQRSVYKICLIVEKEIRASSLLANFYNDIINRSTRQIVCENIFNHMPIDHILNADPLNNHRILLIKSVIEYYLKIRLHHISKIESSKCNETKIRQQFNKLILFKGQ